MKRAIVQGMGPSAWVALQGYGEGLVVAPFLLPPGLIAGAIKGLADKSMYQQCMQELEQEVRKLDTAEILRQTINKTV